MKKIYFIAVSVFALTVANAQQSSSSNHTIQKGTKSAPILFQQEQNTDSVLLSNVYLGDNPIIAADDFSVTTAANAEKFTFYGNQYQGNFLTACKGVLMYIYADNGGEPAGIPKDNNPYIAKIDLATGSGAYSIVESVAVQDSSIKDYTITVDYKKATGSTLALLPNTTYWVAFAPKLSVTNNDTTTYFLQWNWYVGAPQKSNARIVDVNNVMGANFTTWKNVAGLFGDNSLKGLGFSVIGEDVLGTKEIYSSVKDVTVAQEGESLYIFTKNKNLQSSEIYSADGKKVLSAEGSKINISSLNKGVYFVNVKTNDGKLSSTKFIKK